MADSDETARSEKSTGHHPHFHSRRLNRLIHPGTGKIFHIVRQPHEVETKRAELLRDSPKPADFDILIHGTDEHVSAVRDIHRHHEEQRQNLHEQHGETLTRYDRVRNELDTLSSELHNLTDHAIALDASFDKFGYSARLRTTDDSSETASINSGHTSQASKHDDRSLEALRFWKRPTIKQYYHKGLVWRSPNSSEVQSFELFIDLLMVGLIDVVGEVAVSNASGASFLHYVITFAISWKIYGNIVVIMNWFEINDIFSRLSILFILVCLYAFTTNAAYLFEETYTQGLAFYIAISVFTGLYWIWVATMTPLVRPTLFFHALATFVSVALWIGSIHVEYPANLGLIFTAIAIDLLGATVMMPALSIAARNFKVFSRVSKWTEYTPAVNIEHRVERTNAFTALVIGYSVLTIFFQSRAEMPLTPFLGKGILGLIQAFAFNWIYFEIDAAPIHVHAIRRHWFSTAIWMMTHLPFSASFILAASTLSELVIVHDSKGARLEDLGEKYQANSHEEVEQVLRWFYCGGLGVALICLAIIAACHVHKRLENSRLRKRPRLAIRVAIAIVIICLPLAESLNSLELIGITASLVILVLLIDLFGTTCSGDEFWTGGFCKDRKRQTTYTANCKISKRRRQEMQKKLDAGESVTVADALRRTDSVNSVETGTYKAHDGLGAGTY